MGLFQNSLSQESLAARNENTQQNGIQDTAQKVEAERQQSGTTTSGK